MTDQNKQIRGKVDETASKISMTNEVVRVVNTQNVAKEGYNGVMPQTSQPSINRPSQPLTNIGSSGTQEKSNSGVMPQTPQPPIRRPVKFPKPNSEPSPNTSPSDNNSNNSK